MKKEYLAGTVAFAVLTAVISIASAGYAGMYGYAAGDFSFAWGSVKLSKEQAFDMEGINNVEIVCSSANVIFGEADGDRCVVREYLRKNAEAEITVAGDTLLIKKENNYSTISLFGIGFGNNGAEKVEILLPKEYYGKVKAETGSGNIGVDMDLNLPDFSVVTGSGNIRCRNVEAEKIKASAGSGNISFEKAGGIRDISTKSGNIRILGGSGDTFVSAGSGNIEVEGLNGKLDGSAGSGNIKVCAEAVAGDIRITTGSGNIKLEVPRDNGFTYEGKAVSGSIKTDFDDLLEWNKKGKEASGSYGAVSGGLICTQASSGNTTVILR